MFRAVAADRTYGDQDGVPREVAQARLPFALALKPAAGPGPTALTRTPRWIGPRPSRARRVNMGKPVYPQLRADQQFCAAPASAATTHLKVQAATRAASRAPILSPSSSL